MKKSFFSYLKIWCNPNKIHRLKLTNDFCALLGCFIKILYGRLDRSKDSAALEQSFKNRFDGKRAVILPHARTALHCVLRSLDLEEGDEVVMTPLTIAYMVNSIHTLGLKPVFVDIELSTFCFHIEKLEKSITKRTKVILITYLFGIVPDLEKILDIAQRNGLAVAEETL